MQRRGVAVTVPMVAALMLGACGARDTSGVGDANIGSIMGIGFPPHTGGVYQCVNAYGVAAFAERAAELATKYGETFEPPLLAGPEEAYTAKGYQHYPLRTFLTPLEQTARLCNMQFPAPYVLHSSLKAQSDGGIADHAAGYGRLLTAIRDNTYDFAATMDKDIVTHADLPIKGA